MGLFVRGILVNKFDEINVKLSYLNNGFELFKIIKFYI